MWSNFNQNYPYNSYSYRNFQTPFQPQYMQQQQQSFQSTTQQPQNNILWVQGKENARSMQLAPNSTAILLDRGAEKFYIKTTDDIGLGKIRIFNYTEQPDQDSISQTTDIQNSFVTKEQFQQAIKEIKDNNEQLIQRIKQQQQNNSKQSKQPVIISKK